jgi:hypothetical protein
VEHWDFWGWIAYILLASSALGVAINTIAKEHSAMLNGFPSYFRIYILGYGPAIFLILATLIFIFKLLPAISIKKTTKVVTIPNTEYLMMQSHFKDVDIPIAGLTLIMTKPALRNKTFDNCNIIGPAILFVRNSKFIKDHFVGDIDAIFISTTNEKISGVILVENTTFINCTFNKIAFIGSQEVMNNMKRQIKRK